MTDKVVWVYWQGNAPDYIKLCWQTMIKNCPSFKVVLVNDDNIKQYLPDIRDDFFSISQLNNKSNYFRYKVLYEHGGIYLDSDCIVMKDLSSLLNLLSDKIDLIATGSPEYKYGEPESGFIISQPKGIVIKRALDIIDNELNIHKKGHVFTWGTLGPSIIRRAVRGQDYLHLPARQIMPIGWQHAKLFDKELDIEKYLSQDTLAVMLYNQMFKINNSPILKMVIEDIVKSNTLIGRIFRKSLYVK